MGENKSAPLEEKPTIIKTHSLDKNDPLQTPVFYNIIIIYIIYFWMGNMGAAPNSG